MGRLPRLEFDSSDEDDGHSITKQLAETAVGVRELSKQLGRARVQTNIQSVLIITKARDNRLIKLTRELAIYLMQKKPGGDRGLTVYVDQQLRTSKRFDAEGIERDFPEFFLPSPRRRSSSSNSLPSLSSLSSLSSPPSNPTSLQGQLRYWTSEMCSRNPHLFDFVVTLGGDGTVLFTSWLFQRIVPPVLPFALGSLGFLTNFDFADYAGVMDSAIENGIRVNLRMRFTCTVYRAVAPEPGRGSKAVKKVDTGEILMKNLEKGGWEALEGGSVAATTNPHTLANAKSKDKEIMCFTTRPVESFEVLNDLVVDRGPSPYVSLLELFGDEHHMTTVQADGLTVSTPTGSTAYSLSAGGSLVHPEIPALLITPICPHTLSFRPMLLPDTMELRICVPYNSRSTAWASFDGRGRVELKQGDHIKVTASKYPFPTVCADKQSTDWFHAISRTLKWNERERQKSFVVVEEGPAKQRKVSAVSSPEQHSIGGVPVDVNPADLNENELAVEEPGEEEEDKDQEEEDKFDIDVSSPVASAAKELDSSDQPSPSQDTRNPSLDVLPGVPHPPLSEITGSGTATPDRFHVAHPHPPRIHPRHLISTAAEKIQNLQDHPRRGLSRVDSTIASPSSAEPPVPTITPWHRSDERDGDRDNIRAPESLFQSSKSKIPRDRDIEAESMRTPRTEPIQPLDQDGFPFLPNATHQTHADSTLTSSSHANAPHGRIHPHTLHSHPLRPATATSAAPVHPTLAPVNGYGHRHGQGGLITIPRHHVASTSTPTVPGPAHPHPHIRNHRRHASVDSIGGPRRAFAAWGLDESDSNASDSDA
ncbi:hypothetical protein BS47DRAFT_1375925 [Hydnum rufescens UP504]|uniref:ATP-NAD kinase n=1 Tax=Hydnum rufescens UP504 TaxID=1448309 RepID=A0A9P6B3G9_9AGAM|nr:hypothetical protein BS47DRAFT_1375925 [Hydnum rufescens UP504]